MVERRTVRTDCRHGEHTLELRRDTSGWRARINDARTEQTWNTVPYPTAYAALWEALDRHGDNEPDEDE